MKYLIPALLFFISCNLDIKNDNQTDKHIKKDSSIAEVELNYVMSTLDSSLNPEEFLDESRIEELKKTSQYKKDSLAVFNIYKCDMYTITELVGNHPDTPQWTSITKYDRIVYENRNYEKVISYYDNIGRETATLLSRNRLAGIEGCILSVTHYDNNKSHTNTYTIYTHPEIFDKFCKIGFCKKIPSSSK